MEKSKFLKAIIIFLLILNLGTLIFLFMGKGHGGHHRGGRGGKEGPGHFIVEELGFDEKQKDQFNELKQEHHALMNKMEDSIRTQRELLPDVIISGNNAKADSIATQIGGYQKQIELYTYQHFVKVQQLCNEDQKKKFKNIIGDVLKMLGHKKDGPPHR